MTALLDTWIYNYQEVTESTSGHGGSGGEEGPTSVRRNRILCAAGQLSQSVNSAMGNLRRVATQSYRTPGCCLNHVIASFFSSSREGCFAVG